MWLDYLERKTPDLGPYLEVAALICYCPVNSSVSDLNTWCICVFRSASENERFEPAGIVDLR